MNQWNPTVFGDLVFIQYCIELQHILRVTFIFSVEHYYVNMQFTPSHVRGHLGCFQFYAVWNNVTVKMFVFLYPDT